MAKPRLWNRILKAVFLPRTHLPTILLIVLIVSILGAGYLGYLEPFRRILDAESLTLTYESFSLSPYRVLKALFLLVVFVWGAGLLAGIVERRVKNLTRLRASNRELLTKVFQIGIYFLFGIAAIDVLGVDMTTLAVVGGAIGVGIGFGLQKITSNFISGIILLLEKAIEEDDLVELDDGTVGYIRRMGARFTLVETLDSREVMVPNEDFVTSRVTNWTLTNTQGRIAIEVGVSYGSDLEMARECILMAARAHEKCSQEPRPVCFLDEFGDSSVNFVLYFWIDDVTTGRMPVRSEVMFSIWRNFKELGIEIPFPQRDLHICSNATKGAAS